MSNQFEELITTIVKKSTKEDLKQFFINYIKESKKLIINDTHDTVIRSLYNIIKNNHPEHIETFDIILLLQ